LFIQRTCKENEDKTFANCSIPQEKTDDEINAELGLSDASADEANGDGSNSKASGEPNFALLRSNLFLHRNRRTQSIDEVWVDLLTFYFLIDILLFSVC
jgi:hypothetical protein